MKRSVLKASLIKVLLNEHLLHYNLFRISALYAPFTTANTTQILAYFNPLTQGGNIKKVKKNGKAQR